jgi:hypothetical protein
MGGLIERRGVLSPAIRPSETIEIDQLRSDRGRNRPNPQSVSNECDQHASISAQGVTASG